MARSWEEKSCSVGWLEVVDAGNVARGFSYPRDLAPSYDTMVTFQNLQLPFEWF